MSDNPRDVFDVVLKHKHQKAPFDRIKQIRPDGSEFWSARDLQPLLGYGKWQRFPEVIERATAACENSGHKASDHIRGSSKMVKLGSGSTREVADYHLTRYAAYLVAMNGDPRKPEIAAAQTYFAVQTHRQEVAATITTSTQEIPPAVQALIETNLRLVTLLEAELGRRRRNKPPSNNQTTFDFTNLVDPQGERMIVRRTGWYIHPETKHCIFVIPNPAGPLM